MIDASILIFTLLEQFPSFDCSSLRRFSPVMHFISYLVQLALAIFVTIAYSAPPANHHLNARAANPTGASDFPQINVSAVSSAYTGPTYIPTGTVTVLVDELNKTQPTTGSMYSIGKGSFNPNATTILATGVYPPSGAVGSGSAPAKRTP